MPQDPFPNARPYYDPTTPSSGDSFSIAGMKNALQGLGFIDSIQLQPRAHNPANTSIMVRGTDASGFYRPIYAGDADKRTLFASGDSPAISAPASNPRIDIVYLTPSGDIRIQTGTEAASPTLPSLSPSGDTRLPICAIWNKTTQARIVNFEDKDSNSGDGYIYQDLRPWLQFPSAGAGGNFSAVTPLSATGDAQATPGTATTVARSDHRHAGVHALRIPGGSLLQGDVEIAAPGAVAAGNRITLLGSCINHVRASTIVSRLLGTTAIPKDNTIPQQGTEGDQVTELLLSITPKNANNRLLIIAQVHYGVNAGATTEAMALFQDATANALKTVAQTFDSGASPACHTMIHEMAAGGTVQTTFKLKLGNAAGSETYLNAGGDTTNYYGASLISTIDIFEFLPPNT